MITSMIIFQGSNVRRILHNDEWHYSVVDIIAILTESPSPRRYWSDLKIKLKEEGVELYGFIVQLKLLSADGKKYLTDCADKKSLFRYSIVGYGLFYDFSSLIYFFRFDHNSNLG